MVLFILFLPIAAGIAAFLIRSRRTRELLLPAVGMLHTLMTLSLWVVPSPFYFNGWIGVDAPGLVFLTLTSLVFLAISFYAAGYLKREDPGLRERFEEPIPMRNAPETIFVGGMCFFLASMTLVTVSQHLGLLWVGVESSTLSSAPLVYFHRQKRSLEATWKYLLLCSVGIALALLGNVFFGLASQTNPDEPMRLLLTDLVARGGLLEKGWINIGFIFMLVGYGTKMGLAPMHTWLPDAHSEAPSPVSGLLSAAALNVAFLGIWRALQVVTAAGEAEFARHAMIGLGLVSLVVAAGFLIRQRDYKRLLAYSSVEHMGLMALGTGIGGAGVFAALLHAVNHSFIKASLFLLAGNILRRFETKRVKGVRGVMRAMPVTGALWMAGIVAITGTPPFGLFLTKFSIVKSAFDQHAVAVGIVALALLAIAFIGIMTAGLSMAQGESSDGKPAAVEALWSYTPAVALLGMTLVLGFYIPEPVRAVVSAAASTLGGVR